MQCREIAVRFQRARQAKCLAVIPRNTMVLGSCASSGATLLLETALLPKIIVSTTNYVPSYFRENMACLNVGPLRVCQGLFFPASCKTAYLWLTTNCCFMSDKKTHFCNVCCLKLSLLNFVSSCLCFVFPFFYCLPLFCLFRRVRRIAKSDS